MSCCTKEKWEVSSANEEQSKESQSFADDDAGAWAGVGANKIAG